MKTHILAYFMQRNKDFCQSRQGKLIFLLILEMEQPFFMLKLVFLEYQRFHLLSALYHCNENLFHFPFPVLKHPISNS